MNNPPAFAERQWLLRHWWPLLLTPMLLVPLLAWLAPKHGSQPPSWAIITAIGLVLALVTAPVLDVRLDATGAYYRLLPLQWRWRHITWPEVARAYLRRYDPLSEYGGWGIKGTAQNRAYNIANEDGLQLELRDGRRVLLGTQRPAELAQVLATLPLQP
jgi:hypothetical protein